MPFAKGFDPLHHLLVEAGGNVGVVVERADDISRAGEVFTQVLERIRGVDAVLAVTTGVNPNVFLELGYAIRWHDPILIAASKDDLPFDIGHLRAILYEKLSDDEIIARVGKALVETLAQPGPAIERFLAQADAGSLPDLDERLREGTIEYLAGTHHPPHLRRRSADLLAEWLGKAESPEPVAERLQPLARDLQRESDEDVAKAGVRLTQAVVASGIGDSRDLRNATLHRSWEVRTAAVKALTSLFDDHVFRTMKDIKLTYHIPLRSLDKYAVARAETLSAIEREAAVKTLTRLADNPEISSQTRSRLQGAIEALERGPNA
jgi:hypothetical protein